MKLKKNFIVAGLLVIFMLLISVPQVMAGAGIEPPPAGAIIGETEIWGVVVMRCDPLADDIATIRIKRIVNCDVETQPLWDIDWPEGCPTDKSQVEGESLPSTYNNRFFDTPDDTPFIPGTPFFNRVKNFTFEQEGDIEIVSFDAQFKFWTPGP